MKSRYENQINSYRERLEKATAQRENPGNSAARKQAIQVVVADLLNCQVESEVLCKTLLSSLTVFPDQHLELRLKDLPMVFWFAG